jgi:hypothetical protein
MFAHKLVPRHSSHCLSTGMAKTPIFPQTVEKMENYRTSLFEILYLGWDVSSLSESPILSPSFGGARRSTTPTILILFQEFLSIVFDKILRLIEAKETHQVSMIKRFFASSL